MRTSVLGTTLKAWKPKWRPMRCTTCVQWIYQKGPHLVPRGSYRYRAAA